MPKLSQLPAILPICTVAPSPEPPFTLETVRQTVLKFANPSRQQPSVTDVSEAALAAMQRLVDIINTLRSSQPSFLEGAYPRSPETLETLLPYVIEEAYDVLDELWRDESAVSSQQSAVHSLSKLNTQHSTLNTFPEPLLHSSIPFLSTIDALIPSLLWQIARSNYSVMRLIEGVRGRCWQPEQGWAAGMLRLVVMLELEAPTVRWCFDLATGQSAEGLLESIAIVQADEQVLPVQQTAHASAVHGVSDTSCQVKHQLQAIRQLLQTETFEPGDFLQGIAVELLQPEADWQAGELRLRFGFEFSVQVPDADSSEDAQRHPEPIEAELMEEGAAIAASIATTQVSVVSALGRSLSPATLVRASDAAMLERYTQQTSRQQVAQSLCQLHRQSSYADESEPLAIIVQAALIALARKTNVAGIGLQQPTLLLDELVPRLLWSLTSCTYEMMQLLGGLAVHVLQPGATWQEGTLRLLAVLHITAIDLDYRFDLSTGRSMPVNAAPLAKGTIVQASATALCQQPTLIETLTAYLQQQLRNGTPESKPLVDGLTVDWLEDVEQDWQSGTMTLHLSLVFFADAL